MITSRMSFLSLLAPIALYSSSFVSACGGTVSAIQDGGTGSGSGSGSGGSSGSSSGFVSSSSSGGSSNSSSGVSSSSSSGMSGSSSGGTPANGHNYALHQLFLGDTDRQGVTNADAWKSFGQNVDGKITVASSTDVCTLVAGSSKQVQVDGNGGIDNSWGANIIPIIGTLDSTASQNVNLSLQSGAWTQLTYVVGFDDSAGNTTSAVGLTGIELAGAVYPGGSPAWDLTTNWPVTPGDINGCTSTGGCPTGTDPIANAQVQFRAAFQAMGTFTSGMPALISLPINVGGQPLILNIQSAGLTFQPQAPGSVTNGVIFGVLATQDLINGLQQVAGNISTSLCNGSAFQSIATQIEQTSDIVLSGSTVSNTPGTTCNAISIGLGFNATEIAPPTTIAAPVPPPRNPCGDGG
jgi:hypothetical protein